MGSHVCGTSWPCSSGFMLCLRQNELSSPYPQEQQQPQIRLLITILVIKISENNFMGEITSVDE